jgi:hypothetical protein
VPNGVNGVTGYKNVAEMWRQQFCNLLNSNSDTAFKPDVLNVLDNISNYDVVS